MNTGVHVSFRIVVFSEYRPNRRIAGSCGSFIPSFLRNLHTVLNSGRVNLHSHQVMLIVKIPPSSAGDIRDVGLTSCWEDPLWEGMQPTLVILPGESHG